MDDNKIDFLDPEILTTRPKSLAEQHVLDKIDEIIARLNELERRKK